MRMLSLLMLERGAKEAGKDMVIEAARFVTSPAYIPYFDMLENIEDYKRNKRNWNYDKVKEIADNHRTLRLMLGHSAWEDGYIYPLQTIRDNVSLFIISDSTFLLFSSLPLADNCTTIGIL